MAEASTRTVERALALLATVCETGATNLVDSARECELAHREIRYAFCCWPCYSCGRTCPRCCRLLRR